MEDRFQYLDDDNIVVGEGFVLEDAPAGCHHAVCVDVVSLGLESKEYDGKVSESPKVMIVWQIETADGERQKNGARFTAERKFTASLHPKGHLRPFLEKWRGRDFTPEELNGFNLAKLKGANCLLSIAHNPRQNGEGTWVNVLEAEPFVDADGKPVTDPAKHLKPENYTRRDYTKKEKAAAATAGSTTTSQPESTTDGKSDWVPF